MFHLSYNALTGNYLFTTNSLIENSQADPKLLEAALTEADDDLLAVALTQVSCTDDDDDFEDNESSLHYGKVSMGGVTFRNSNF